MKKIDGFDDCILGFVERTNTETILCYDKSKMISKLMITEAMSFEEAFEHFDYNIYGSWVGNDTPCFLTNKLEDYDLDSI